MSSEAQTILYAAQSVLTERGKQYGDATPLFRQMALRFSLVLGIPVTPFTAARLMAELKNARMDLAEEYIEDSLIDAINYTALAGAIAHGEKTQKD